MNLFPNRTTNQNVEKAIKALKHEVRQELKIDYERFAFTVIRHGLKEWLYVIHRAEMIDGKSVSFWTVYTEYLITDEVQGGLKSLGEHLIDMYGSVGSHIYDEILRAKYTHLCTMIVF